MHIHIKLCFLFFSLKYATLHYISTFFFTFLVILGSKPRVSHMLGKRSTTKLYPQPSAHFLAMCIIPMAFKNTHTQWANICDLVFLLPESGIL